jgi:DNA (cytosine-5)-methyltransferase 1
LVSRLQRRLDMAGSTLFAETWKRRSTPLRRRYWEHTASGRRTSGSDCTYVPTPNTLDTIDREGLRPSRIATNRKSGYLTEIIPLSAVPTPQKHDERTRGNTEANSQSELCSVATPSARDWKDTSGMSQTGVDPDGSIRSRLDQLPRQAQLADSGQTATGGTPATASTRPIEPGIFPLAHGVANRVLKLRGYGDAINAEVAAEFIKTAAESIDERQSTRHHLSCAR